jgi:hypothetical protein
LVLAWFAGADMSGVPGGIVGAVILFALYFLPATVAAWRHHPSVNAITALNLFLGWTLIGWVYALVGPSQVAVTPAPGPTVASLAALRRSDQAPGAGVPFLPARAGAAGPRARMSLHSRAAMISTLDAHELVKDLKASGFTDEQAEAVTRAVRLAQDLDVSNLATKTDLVVLRSELAQVELRLIKWVIGVGVAAVLALTGVVWTATQVLMHAHP